jgi:hypothetical protein
LACGRDPRTTQCKDCLQQMLTCEGCFVRDHRLLPSHWAEVWDAKQGCFICKDISQLGAGNIIQLGHGGDVCCKPHGTCSFTIVDTNGIHATHLAFCGCTVANNVEKLMQAGLFPGTTREPKTAFTFKLLKEYHLHSLEFKKSAYRYMSAKANR